MKMLLKFTNEKTQVFRAHKRVKNVVFFILTIHKNTKIICHSFVTQIRKKKNRKYENKTRPNTMQRDSELVGFLDFLTPSGSQTLCFNYIFHLLRENKEIQTACTAIKPTSL